jgi:hypothetical protein
MIRFVMIEDEGGKTHSVVPEQIVWLQPLYGTSRGTEALWQGTRIVFAYGLGIDTPFTQEELHEKLGAVVVP